MFFIANYEAEVALWIARSPADLMVTGLTSSPAEFGNIMFLF